MHRTLTTTNIFSVSPCQFHGCCGGLGSTLILSEDREYHVSLSFALNRSRPETLPLPLGHLRPWDHASAQRSWILPLSEGGPAAPQSAAAISATAPRRVLGTGTGHQCSTTCSELQFQVQERPDQASPVLQETTVTHTSLLSGPGLATCSPRTSSPGCSPAWPVPSVPRTAFLAPAPELSQHRSDLCPGGA